MEIDSPLKERPSRLGNVFDPVDGGPLRILLGLLERNDFVVVYSTTFWL